MNISFLPKITIALSKLIVRDFHPVFSLVAICLISIMPYMCLQNKL